MQNSFNDYEFTKKNKTAVFGHRNKICITCYWQKTSNVSLLLFHIGLQLFKYQISISLSVVLGS